MLSPEIQLFEPCLLQSTLPYWLLRCAALHGLAMESSINLPVTRSL